MPAIADMITKMAKLGLNEDNPSIALQTTYLTYIQSTWLELYGEMAKAFPSRLLASQTVTVTSGTGALSPIPFIMVSTRDVGNNLAKLQNITYSDLEDISPTLAVTGAPSYVYTTANNVIKTYPINSTSLRVTYVPRPIDLSLTTAEDDIPVPPPFQEVLMWGGLRLLNLDERDKNVGGEIQLAETMYQRLRGNFFSYLEQSQLGVDVRVKGYLM
jgi:hypothetical protein